MFFFNALQWECCIFIYVWEKRCTYHCLFLPSCLHYKCGTTTTTTTTTMERSGGEIHTEPPPGPSSFPPCFSIPFIQSNGLASTQLRTDRCRHIYFLGYSIMYHSNQTQTKTKSHSCAPSWALSGERQAFSAMKKCFGGQAKVSWRKRTLTNWQPLETTCACNLNAIEGERGSAKKHYQHHVCKKCKSKTTCCGSTLHLHVSLTILSLLQKAWSLYKSLFLGS